MSRLGPQLLHEPEIERVPRGAQRPARVYINGRFLQQPATGVQRYGRELLKAWDRLLATGEIDPQDIELQLLAPRGPIEAPRLKQIELRQVGRLRGHLWTQLELPFFARDGFLFSPGNIHPLLSLGRLNGVVTIHDLSYETHPEAYSRAFRLLYSVLVPAALRRADAIITVSRAERANILNRHPFVHDRIHAVHHGAPQGHEGEAPAILGQEVTEGRPFVLWVGTLIARKNPQGAIDAVARVNQTMPLDLVIVGASEAGLLTGGFRIPRGLADRVHFLGRVAEFSRLRRLYADAVALVFPSFYEGFGIPPLEAMQMGCPVVASDIPALQEVCGDAALYADATQPAEIARLIALLMTDPSLRERLQQNGRRRAALFTWESCARETVAILARVLDQGRSRQGSPWSASASEATLRAAK